MKKFISISLLFAMLILVFSGCGKETSSDPNKVVTLKWVMPWSNQKDSQMVEDAANEMLKGLLPNTKLDLIFEPSMDTKWSLWMAGRQDYDIAHSGFATDLQTEINKNSYLQLNDLIEKYAPTIKENMNGIFKDDYNTGIINGKIYALVNMQYLIKETIRMRVDESLKGYLDVPRLISVAQSSPTTTDEFYSIIDEYLNKVYSNKLAGTEKIKKYIEIDSFYSYVAKRGYEFIGGKDSNICYKVQNSGKVQFVDFHQTEEFKTFIKWASKWFSKGYINKDILTSSSTYENKGSIVAFHKDSRFGYDATSTKTGNDGSYTYLFLTLNNPKYDYLGANDIGKYMTYESIPFTAKNPERAMQLLELLNTEKGAPLLHLITYGIEGTHYKKLDDESITCDYADYGQGNSSTAYGVPNWMTGNMFNNYIVSPAHSVEEKNYALNYYKNYLPNVAKTPLYGYSFDNSPVANELSQMMAVNQEYEKQIAYGTLSDYSTALNAMNKKMVDAGLDTVIKEFQKQADTYITSKK